MKINTSLTTDQVTVLKKTWQYRETRCAFLPPYQPRFEKISLYLDNINYQPEKAWKFNALNSDVTMEEFEVTGFHEQLQWTPVPVIGPHRVAYVDQDVVFEAQSYGRYNAAVATGAQRWWSGLKGQTYTATASGTSTCTISFALPGLYGVTYECWADDQTGEERHSVANRWVRVLSATDADNVDVCPAVTIDSISGSIDQGGWEASVTLGYVDETLDIEDHAGVLVFGSDQYGDYDAEKAREVLTAQTVETWHPTGDQSQPVYFFGYIVAGSIHRDIETGSVRFTIRTPEYFLQQIMTMYRDYWVDPDKGTGFCLPKLQAQDVIHHLLCDKSRTQSDPVQVCNFAEWHDIHLNQLVASDWPAHQNILYRCTINEGMIWNGLQDLQNNDYLVMYCDKLGGLHVDPDLTCRPYEYWHDIADPTSGLLKAKPLLTMDNDLILGVDINQDVPRRVKLVKINATTSADAQLEAERDAGFYQGAWQIVDGILADNQLWLDTMADALLSKGNGRIRLSITTGLNNALDLNDIVLIAHHSDPHNRLIGRSGHWILGDTTYSELGSTTKLG